MDWTKWMDWTKPISKWETSTHVWRWKFGKRKKTLLVQHLSLLCFVLSWILVVLRLKSKASHRVGKSSTIELKHSHVSLLWDFHSHELLGNCCVSFFPTASASSKGAEKKDAQGLIQLVFSFWTTYLWLPQLLKSTNEIVRWDGRSTASSDLPVSWKSKEFRFHYTNVTHWDLNSKYRQYFCSHFIWPVLFPELDEKLTDEIEFTLCRYPQPA